MVTKTYKVLYDGFLANLAKNIIQAELENIRGQEETEKVLPENFYFENMRRHCRCSAKGDCKHYNLTSCKKIEVIASSSPVKTVIEGFNSSLPSLSGHGLSVNKVIPSFLIKK